MLHELFLALSGHPSPLFSTKPLPESLSSSLSPSETALLRSIAHLGRLHMGIREQCSMISSSHISVICRAVSTAITSIHLAQFQTQIVHVERDVLLENASLVGAYQIVPLSAVAGSFEGWAQKLEWLQRIVTYILDVNASEKSKPSKTVNANTRPATGAALMDRLRSEARTGYPNIERLALDLAKVAELAWLRQVSTWILYGRLPTLGTSDFFVHRVAEASVETPFNAWQVQSALCPSFLTPETAQSILFIGKSLNYIRNTDSTATKLPKIQTDPASSASQSTSGSPNVSMLTNHLNLLTSISSPISDTTFTRTISAIRVSLSQNALQKLLSFTQIVQVLHVFREFFLLQRGEFAIALIDAADACLASKSQTSSYTAKSSDTRMSGVMIKEGEVAAALNQAWATLASLQSIDDDEDEELDLARELVYLTIKQALPTDLPAEISNPSLAVTLQSQPDDIFADLLLATPTLLSLRIASPLDLFLTSDDIGMYSRMHAFLLSIRRAQSHLSDLWKLTSLRREHSTTGTPRAQANNAGKEFAKLKDERQRRTRRMRRTWNVVGLVTSFLVELGEYLHGEVVLRSWEAFESWLRPIAPHGRPSNDSYNRQETPPNSMDATMPAPGGMPQATHDPESLMRAHRAFLRALLHALLLDDNAFTHALRALLTKVDYLVGLMGRLAEVRLVSAARDGPPSSQQRAEEDELASGIERAGSTVEKDVASLKRRLRELDAERLGENLDAVRIDGGGDGGGVPFAPWRAAGLDRLLLKLDVGSFGL